MKNLSAVKSMGITVLDAIRKLIFYFSLALLFWISFQIFMYYSGTSLGPLDVIISFFVNLNLLLFFIIPLLFVYSIINLFLRSGKYKRELFFVNLMNLLLVFHHVWLPYFGVNV